MKIIKNFFFKNFFYINTNFGDFLDVEGGLALKNFFSNLSIKGVTYKNNLLNKDLRSFFCLKNISLIDSSLEHMENHSFIIINSNLRFESPILNLKIRKVFSDFENDIFVIGFISNFNFDYVHLNNKLTKNNFNFISQNQENKTIFSTNQFFLKNSNLIFNNISKIIQMDLNFFEFENLNNFNFLSLDMGQLENKFIFKKNFFKIQLLHHIEEEFINIPCSFFKILLPTSFFFEKTTTYINNSFIFFNTLSHFSIKIPNTKPE